MMPMLVASISTMSAMFDKYVLVELVEGEEEKSEERASEEKDAVEEDLFQENVPISNIELMRLPYFARNIAFSAFCTDVVTPPPENA